MHDQNLFRWIETQIIVLLPPGATQYPTLCKDESLGYNCPKLPTSRGFWGFSIRAGGRLTSKRCGICNPQRDAAETQLWNKETWIDSVSHDPMHQTENPTTRIPNSRTPPLSIKKKKESPAHWFWLVFGTCWLPKWMKPELLKVGACQLWVNDDRRVGITSLSESENFEATILVADLNDAFWLPCHHLVISYMLPPLLVLFGCICFWNKYFSNESFVHNPLLASTDMMMMWEWLDDGMILYD